MKSELKPVTDGRVAIGPGYPLFVTAGLCIVEEEEATLRQAEALKRQVEGLPISFVFKSSFDKANRSSLSSYRGPGMDEGLRILAKVKETLDLPILTDVHETAQCAAAAEVADVLQIPAFLCRQTDLLLAAGATGRIINVKKGQFLAPHDVKPLIAKLHESGCDKVTITERGVSFGYNTLVNDFRALPQIRALGVPVIFDATHSVQQPGGHGERSGGDRTMVPFLARAAAAVGTDGFFFEVHEDPTRARSDADNALLLSDLRPLLETLLAIREAAETAE
ncbi:MAG: 3-deoxy-8-phosphooctulonate synthase [Planctomycetes bacterium]|nr:3-deoxy-8-phosphooctulonate synthase [Planctomycetota bacterium]